MSNSSDICSTENFSNIIFETEFGQVCTDIDYWYFFTFFVQYRIDEIVWNWRWWLTKVFLLWHSLVEYSSRFQPSTRIILALVFFGLLFRRGLENCEYFLGNTN